MNEHVLKPAVAEPRPSIEYLADTANGALLVQGAQAFYRLPDKTARSAYLEKRLEASPGLKMPELLREHWIEETGYSFPSGHAFAATALAGWFMFMILCAGSRRWLLALFWGWVVAVCYSRVILGVHRPVDVLAGSVEGALLAALAVLVGSVLLHRRRSSAFG
ncbi:phosphatase PAP2 family protein [Thiolapillus sp.]